MKTSVTVDDIDLAASSVGLVLDASEKSEILLHLQKQVLSFAVIDEVETGEGDNNE